MISPDRASFPHAPENVDVVVNYTPRSRARAGGIRIR